MLDKENDNLHDDAEGMESASNQPETEATNPEASEDAQDNKVTTEVEGDDEVQNEIDESNAEDAEDEGNIDRHEIPLLDYHSMNMDKLTDELYRLVSKERIQAIKDHVDQIRSEFDLKYQELLEQKKEDFIHDGGNESDFNYTAPIKKRFNDIYSEYRDKRNQYYKNLEQKLKSNLDIRLEIIEELKGLINVEENINDTYKHFKELQDRWRNAGPVPRMNYNDVWRTYHHHVEIFYDFLDLNRDLRDLDFKHNLEEKEKIIEKAEALAVINDVNKAFRELQILHKIWKEDIGPVDREHREDVWNRFSEATKTIHRKRQEYFKNQDEIHESNLQVKQEIIRKIEEIADHPVTSHNLWQKQIREVEELREKFFNAGRVPYKVNESTWAAFKEAVRRFNRKKNGFYKNLKKEQHDNLERKIALVKLAESLKDSDDWDMTTPVMKKIQSDWKQIGHVPRKYSDKVWNEFKAACNHYFDRFHARKNKDFQEEMTAFDQKKDFLDRLKSYELSGDKDKDLEQIKAFIEEWKSYGRVPFNKKNIESKFNKILDALFKKLDVDKQKSEMIKYGNKLQEIAEADNDHALRNEKIFIRRKIDEVKAEIRQLENNLQFINADANNPIVKDVIKNIDGYKNDLSIWKAKLKKLKNLDEN
ncbi:DUF349 domain-containing protein [Robertkochia solimangrovi]|uniref:DUF349 domain-containing protein n=1 Tax=Robertkochia solimangrovi TaxID=2213046 RepID=UPI00117E13B2|nr:DUF349 domain-containing protein [Robertkochia solimangrovi]TRZ43615.1 DUF349 domain-containing protein [Robertkochia solimangrovi]